MWNHVSYALSACSFALDLVDLLVDAYAGRPPSNLPKLLLNFATVILTRPPRRSRDA